ncbi:MAG: glutamate 5-kinase [Fuerstiella sp.]
MQDAVRQEVFAASRTVIVKIGSNVLTREDDQLDDERIQALAIQIDRIRQTGRKVVIVSSGAVAAGIGALGMTGRPRSLPELQATAAAGQPKLMTAWAKHLGETGHFVAQILLTIDDFRSRHRYLNVRNTVRTLLAHQAIPIVNENDSVGIQEIALGDNDQLAAMLATLVPDPLLVILSSVDGLMNHSVDGSPSRQISIVSEPDEELLSYVTDDRSSRGRGGMASKLKAILKATGMGESVVLANGCQNGVLDQIRCGEDVGTLFLSTGGVVAAWKKWIGFASGSEGALQVDAGARSALLDEGASLLAVGITSVRGTFPQGATVDVTTESGTVIGRGLVNYSSVEITSIMGQSSEQIEGVLNHVPYSEVIHRDNLAVTGTTHR